MADSIKIDYFIAFGHSNVRHFWDVFTQKGFRVDKAKKTELTAVVYVDKKREDYMELQVDGGTRRPKRASIVVPSNKNTTGITQYASGNITKGAMNKIKKNKKK